MLTLTEQADTSKEDEAKPKKSGKKTGKSKGKKSDSDDGSQGDGKRNLSLEALFQVTHHELENISRKNDSEEEDEDEKEEAVEEEEQKAEEQEKGEEESKTSSDEVIQVTKDMVAVVPSSGSGPAVLHIVQMPDSSSKLITNVKILQMHSEDEGESGDGSQTEVISLPISEVSSIEPQGHTLVYAKSVDQAESTVLSQSLTSPGQMLIESPVPAIIDSDMANTLPQVGRKRKHPAKPGKHICPYCGRGCAKPSVLQKHIRAHTGERPYPCIPCGFSFKTKSNLYKHCKSRAHAIKAGLPMTGKSDSLDSSRDLSMDVEDDELTELAEEEDLAMSVSDHSGSQPRELRTEDTGEEVIQVVEVVQYADEHEHGLSAQADASSTLVRAVSTSSTKLILTDRQYYDVAYIPGYKEGVQDKAAIDVVSMSDSPLAYVSKAPPIISIAEPSSISPVSAADTKAVTLKTTSIHKPLLTIATGLTRESDTKNTPKLMISKMRADTIGAPSFTPESRSLPITKKLLAETSRSLSLPAPAHRLTPLDPKNPVTPEMLSDRITQLITANAAIIDMPMADAPRPKRMSRQNSEVAPTKNEAAAAVQGLQAAFSSIAETSTTSHAITKTKLILPKAHSVDPQIPMTKSASVDTDGHSVDTSLQNIQNIVKVAQLVVANTGGSTSPGGTMTPVTLPQEIKIQIKLAKPGVSQGYSTQMIGQPCVQFPPSSPIVTPPTPTKDTDNPEGSVIKDLLLKGKSGQQEYVKSDLQVPPAVQTVDVATTEKPDSIVVSQGQQVVVMEGKRHMASMAQSSLDVPMPVAEDVEVASSDSPRRAILLTRSRSMPSGPTTPLTPSTPFANILFDNYDPQKPPKRGRPKGSKNRPKDSLDPQTPITPQCAGSPQTSMTPRFGGGGPGLLPQTPLTPHFAGGGPGLLPQTPTTPHFAGGGPGLLSHSSGVISNVVRLPINVLPINTSPSGNVSPNIPGQRPTLKLMIPQPHFGVRAGQSAGVGGPFGVGGSLSATPSLSMPHLPTMSPSVALTRSASLNTSTLTPGLDTPTTQSLWKLKLKGKLLMKRSISVERMLQETERQEKITGTPSIGASGLLPGSPKFADIFRRSESVDEAALRLQQRARHDSFGENSVIARMLASKSPHKSGSPHKPIVPSPLVRLERQKAVSEESPPAKLRQEHSNDQEEEVILVSTDEDENEHKTSTTVKILGDIVTKPPVSFACRVPINESMKIPSPSSVNMSPMLKLKNMDPKLQIIPNLIVGGNRVVVRRLEAVISEKEEDQTETEKSGEQTEIKEEKSENGDEKEEGKESDEVVKEEREEEDMEGIEETTEVVELSTSVQEENERKLCAQLLLLAHQYPVLRNQTMSTFCTVVKPQPMYVPQGTNHKISMYSNWRVATYNPNPLGLTSKELIGLYHSRWYDVDPLYKQSQVSDSKVGVLTHSSYWNFYNQMKAASVDEADEDKVEAEVSVQQVSEVLKLSVDMNNSMEEVEVQAPVEPVFIRHISSVDSPIKEQIQETVLTPSKEAKRIQLFAGGFKSNEDYTYIRGRGHGKYVCEECGIRCKKPSMLKKHIRTHTDLRPYHCKYCSFSFKTKGNLTKHMKSKAHHKKCLELGIIPVPINIDDSQIDIDALAKQNEVARGNRISGLDDTGSSFDDGAEDDDKDDGDEEDEEEVEETVIIDDTVFRIEEKGLVSIYF